jgi:hypothetical protein
MSLRNNIIGVISKRTTPSPVARTQNYFVNPQEQDLYKRLRRRRTIRHSPPGLEHTRRKGRHTTMKKFGFAAVLASGLTAAILGLAAPAAAAPTGTTNATGSTVHQTTGNAQITAEPGAAAQQAAQLQQPFGGDMGALLFHHYGSRSGAGRH